MQMLEAELAIVCKKVDHVIHWVINVPRDLQDAIPSILSGFGVECCQKDVETICIDIKLRRKRLRCTIVHLRVDWVSVVQHCIGDSGWGEREWNCC